MTTENVIHQEGEININNLRIEHFSAKDCTDNNTDISTSIKLVDQNNNIWMSIETQPLEMYAEEAQREIHGCFIRKFEYDERLIDCAYSLVWTDFLREFDSNIRYSMFFCLDNKLKCRYQYVWAQKSEYDYCCIADILNLKRINQADINFYRRDIKENW